MKGRIQLNTVVRPGIVRLGQDGVGTIDKFYERTVWADWGGQIIINGQTGIGRGGRICVGKDAKLSFGNNFTLSGRSSIICMKSINFGDDNLLSWDILMMDTDFHKIISSDGEERNKPSAIDVGNHVWIGCRATILKGVKIANNTVIAANTVVARNIEKEGCVYGCKGNEPHPIIENITWNR